MGVLSYSAYLSHATIIAWVKAWIGGPKLFQGMLSLALVLLISHIVHVLIEKPFARLRKQSAA